MELIDSHAHVDDSRFDEDREEMFGRARAAGVTTLLAIGTGPGAHKLDAALPFAEAHEWIYTTVGIHPHEARLDWTIFTIIRRGMCRSACFGIRWRWLRRRSCRLLFIAGMLGRIVCE